jgi:hypothetical protein
VLLGKHPARFPADHRQVGHMAHQPSTAFTSSLGITACWSVVVPDMSSS